MVVSKVYFIINNFLLPQNYTQKKVHTRIALKYMKRNMFGKHRLLEIQPTADYLYFPCRIQMRRRSLQRQIQMDSTQIHKQEWMFSDRNALRKVRPLANSSTLYTSPPSIQIHSLHTNTFFCIYAREHRPLIDLIMRRRKTAINTTFSQPVMMMMVMMDTMVIITIGTQKMVMMEMTRRIFVTNLTT